MGSVCRRDQDQIELRIPCRPEFVRTVRRAVADFAESFSLPDSVIAELEVAASEAVSNVVRHAYADRSSAPPVCIRCTRRADGVTVEVVDEGCGFTAPEDGTLREPDSEREGGYGIVLMVNLMDSVNYISKPLKGTKLRMTKRASRALNDASGRAPRPDL